MLLSNSRGGYSFLRGGSAYSAGVAAAPGFTIEHVRLARTVPLMAGFALVEEHVRAAGRPLAALCAIALRSPEPFSFAGFKEFNAVYAGVLKSWELMVDGINPVARTNVAPAVDPPSEPSLYSFAYTVPAEELPLPLWWRAPASCPRVRPARTTWCAAGRRHQTRWLPRRAVCWAWWKDACAAWVRAGTRSPATNIYTVHDVNALLAAEVLPHIGPAGQHGVTWHYTRPPIISIEYEMDLFGGTRETVVQTSK